MSNEIESLFKSLHDKNDEPKLISYGKALQVSDTQVRTLVTLSYVIPFRLTAAIELIELGCCKLYRSGTKHVYVIDKYVVCLSSWTCPCHDFVNQLHTTNGPQSRWKIVCQHLLASYIIANRIPILDFSLVEVHDVSLSSIVNVSLLGTVETGDEI